jgi:hypothetical protein
MLSQDAGFERMVAWEMESSRPTAFCRIKQR